MVQLTDRPAPENDTNATPADRAAADSNGSPAEGGAPESKDQ
jgi:hypothetical protein